MAMERWGAMSVEDHKNIHNLIANVVLYDRVLVPTPASNDLMRWREEKWDPALQKERLEQLGPLAVRREWGEARQAAHGQLQASTALEYDVELLTKEQRAEIALGNTRLLLAQEEQLKLPAGVSHATVVAAFNSGQHLVEAGADTRPVRGPAPDSAANIEKAVAVFFYNEILLPSLENDEASLKKAIELAKDNEDLRDKRREYYEWQRGMVEKQVKPEVAIAEMRELVQRRNEAYEKAAGRVTKKLGFTLAGVAISLAGAIVSENLLPVMGAMLAYGSYKVFDSHPVVTEPRGRPAAMFHDVREALR